MKITIDKTERQTTGNIIRSRTQDDQDVLLKQLLQLQDQLLKTTDPTQEAYLKQEITRITRYLNYISDLDNYRFPSLLEASRALGYATSKTTSMSSYGA